MDMRTFYWKTCRPSA